jgi:hypothetical protein
MNHKISHLKWLQRTTPNKLGEKTSTQCTRTFCVPPTTFLFLWLRNKIHYAFMAGTQKTTFLVRNEHNIFHLKGLQTTISRWGGCTSIHTVCQNIMCASYQFCAFLEVHHHLTKVIQIGIIFISQILQLSLVIGILYKF